MLETPAKPLLKQKVNPAVGLASQSTKTLLALIHCISTIFIQPYREVWWARMPTPTAFLFQKLGFAVVSVMYSI
ncbi:MAG: hypothetical protein IK065_00200 [Neisseriaceae bacterium]|nr:hypothetical protein [Neisseriaceae bacterium]